MATRHEYNKDLLREKARKKHGAGDLLDVEAEYNSALSYGENAANMGLQQKRDSTRSQIKGEEKQLHISNVEEATGQTFSSDLSGEQDFKVLPRKISGKGIEITIDAPILTDQDALKNACTSALAAVVQSMVLDVTTNRASIFADKEGHWNFVDYGGSKEYYESGMIPVWKGGLLGKFEPLEIIDRMEHRIKFTSDYAELIEEGGSSIAYPDSDWFTDKPFDGNSKDKQIFLFTTIHPHPFTAAVARKLYDHLEDFGYLDTFSQYFVFSLK